MWIQHEVLNPAPKHEDVWGSEVIDSHILNLGTKGTWFNSFPSRFTQKVSIITSEMGWIPQPVRKLWKSEKFLVSNEVQFFLLGMI
jgi:hypothetical protein